MNNLKIPINSFINTTSNGITISKILRALFLQTYKYKQNDIIEILEIKTVKNCATVLVTYKPQRLETK